MYQSVINSVNTRCSRLSTEQPLWMQESSVESMAYLLALTAIVLVQLARGTDAAVRIITDKRLCLDAHNKLRALHKNTPNMVWDTSVQRSAEKYAKHLAENNLFAHDKSWNGGENLYAGTDSCPKSCAAAVLAWYNEIKDYNYNRPGFSMSTGHFTQVVWRRSVRLGVGVAVVKSGGWERTVVVGRYLPSGNYAGQFRSNVLPRKPGAVTPTLKQLDPNPVGCNVGGNRGGHRGGNRAGTRPGTSHTRVTTVIINGNSLHGCKDHMDDCAAWKHVQNFCRQSGPRLVCKKTCGYC